MKVLQARLYDQQRQALDTRPRRRAQEPGGLGRPLRAHPHLQLPAGPRDRPPHQPDALQPGPGDGGRALDDVIERPDRRRPGGASWRRSPSSGAENGGRHPCRHARPRPPATGRRRHRGGGARGAAAGRRADGARAGRLHQRRRAGADGGGGGGRRGGGRPQARSRAGLPHPRPPAVLRIDAGALARHAGTAPRHGNPGRAADPARRKDRGGQEAVPGARSRHGNGCHRAGADRCRAGRFRHRHRHFARGP